MPHHHPTVHFVERVFTDVETGQVLNVVEETEVKPKRGPQAVSRDKFALIYGADKLQAIAPNMSQRIFWKYVAAAKFDEPEIVYFTTELAKELHTVPDLVTRAITRLEKEGLIFRLARFRMMLNPQIVWYGTPAGRERALTELKKAGKL